MVKQYTSANGYTGKMFGEASFVVYNPQGKVVYQTNRRTFNTFMAMKHEVDTYPQKGKGELKWKK